MTCIEFLIHYFFELSSYLFLDRSSYTFKIIFSNCILLYELHKTVIVAREGLGYDERSEECSKLKERIQQNVL
jgi:hypothetical protein